MAVINVQVEKCFKNGFVYESRYLEHFGNAEIDGIIEERERNLKRDLYESVEEYLKDKSPLMYLVTIPHIEEEFIRKGQDDHYFHVRVRASIDLIRSV
jgi:hypothetical protein